MDLEAVEGFGERLGQRLLQAGGEGFVGLRGPLGAGKSVMARAIARGLGVRDDMPSPTYNLRLDHRTAGGTAVIHLDLYRLTDAEGVWALGWEELDAPGQVVLVEWPERAAEHLPSGRIDLSLTPVPGAPGLRDVTVTGTIGGAEVVELLTGGSGGGP